MSPHRKSSFLVGLMPLLVIGLAMTGPACKRQLRHLTDSDGSVGDMVVPGDTTPPDDTQDDVPLDQGQDQIQDTGTGIDSPVIPTCPGGQHVCPGGCVANDDPRTCGTSCTPCEAPLDGTATCDGMSCGGTCPTGKKLCNGACIDMAAACAGGCPTGYHACGGLCPSVMDVKSCGTSCLPCPVPGGAVQASCDGTKCDFQCMTGYHKCADRCVLDADATACGMACVPCATDPNGAARCVGGACGVTCNASYHACGGRCVSNRDVATCGATSCTPCQIPTGGMATCDGTACVPACPTAMKLCNGTCIDMAAACSGQCPMGTHNCSGVCQPNNNVNSCGTSCTACAKPVGAADTTCDGTTCDFTCGPGYHRCGSRCAPDNDPTGCGAACTSCLTDPNGMAACVGGACGLMCSSGYHVCGNRCVSNMNVANCGPTSCVACQAPTGGGSVTCDGLACQPSCPMGTKLCGGACIDNAAACNGMCPANTHNCSGICQSNTSTSYCGTACVSCPVPPSNGMATCTGTCGITCGSGYRNCPGTNLCIPTMGCCGNSECTSGPPNTVGTCGSANTCSYACTAAGTKTCPGGACIPSSGCCSNAECTMPSAPQCNLTTHMCGPCAAVPAADRHFVDPAGTDDTNHGAAYGPCAYRTLTYALKQATGEIALRTGTYSAATGETFPMVLVGGHKLLCNYMNTMPAAISGAGPYALLGQDVSVVITGNLNAINDCVITTGGAATTGPCVFVFGSASGGSHIINNVDISGCGTGIRVERDANNITLSNSKVRMSSGFGLYFVGRSSNTMILNNAFGPSNIAADIYCDPAISVNPGVTGSGNTGQVNGKPTCVSCMNCPF